ncbi:MAG: class I SAM-dependent methyltransferase [Bacteroidia bacterium]|nr:class I SAM-dependent methyltransferase [Bacteroidia bacterium]
MLQSINVHHARHWPDYELLDCGHFLKLERFGPYTLIRPEPQALWNSVWDLQQWRKLAHVEFVPSGSHSGKWKKLKNMPDNWELKYTLNNKKKICFNLALTSFKHLGIFPEQSVNWDKVATFASNKTQLKGLNLFAYTGGATLAAVQSGIAMTHVDSIKQVVSWANRNRELSGIPDNIRWIVDDAFSFVQREVRRKKTYEIIILDPPAYGHGPKGEKWKLEEQLQKLVENVMNLLNPNCHLLILNVYSLGFSSLMLKNVLEDAAKKFKSALEIGELALQSKTGKWLPLGNVGWIQKE